MNPMKDGAGGGWGKVSALTLFPEDGFDWMTRDRAVESKGLAGNRCHVVHGPNERRSQDLQSSRVFDGGNLITRRAFLRMCIQRVFHRICSILEGKACDAGS